MPLGSRCLRTSVAKDRRIIIADAETRHRRKSRSQRVDGYKRHVCGTSIRTSSGLDLDRGT